MLSKTTNVNNMVVLQEKSEDLQVIRSLSVRTINVSKKYVAEMLIFQAQLPTLNLTKISNDPR